MLFGLAVPFSAIEGELNALLEVGAPATEHAPRLRDLQLRPENRVYLIVQPVSSVRMTCPSRRPNQTSSSNPWLYSYGLTDFRSRCPNRIGVRAIRLTRLLSTDVPDRQ